MEEYNYTWTWAGNTVQSEPPAPCDECGKDGRVFLVVEDLSSALPLVDETYTYTEECVKCGHIFDEQEMAVDEFEAFKEDHEIPDR